ncbi:thiamine phosphate synthase [Brockia lithotrophica]|uniref:Thiamine-phosphate synthase n=1 Tax=Brockia lithotrophica TaxID=933949 RepID=A0A660KW63_9BACL|nr:thiamine phosphate synthase [Brockia lithotrophica]RKQ84675.1 thiamine-phosphate diphosphorylase [Brockia lithotrophica]
MKGGELRDALSVYFLFGTQDTSWPPEALLEAAVRGGVTAYQFREKGPGALEGEDRLRLARKLRGLARRLGILFFVDDDVDLALAVEADGVHVGEEDLSVAEVRQRVGGKLLVGASCATVVCALRAREAGADYLGVGPVFPTPIKAEKRPVGLEIFGEMRRAGVELPLVAIGGIDANNAHLPVQAGADGVAFIRAVARARDPEGAARAIAEAVRRGRAKFTQG